MKTATILLAFFIQHL